MLAGVVAREGRSQMSKGDDLWVVRDAILKMLYHKGAFYRENGVDKKPFAQELDSVIKEAGLEVSMSDRKELLDMLREDKLIWARVDIPGGKLYLTHKGFKEARRIVETERAGQLPLEE